MDLPPFLYGTAWKEERTEALVRTALERGFRGIDTANQRKHYDEAAVGRALGEVPRSALFLQTKFTHLPGQDHRLPYDRDAPPEAQVKQSLESSLEHLDTDYVDSYILHGPMLRQGLTKTDLRVWRTMEALQQAGRCLLLGVSNVSLEQLEMLHRLARVKPTFVQNRCYARTGWDRDVRVFCRAHGMVYQGFSLLTANGREIASKPIENAAKRLGVSAAEVVFRFAMEVGMLPLTGTSSAEHMRVDLASLELRLTPDEVAAIEALG